MRIIYLICALLLCLSPTLAQAHEVRPAFLRITETAPAQFDVSWKQPVVSGKRLRIRPTFDEICAPTPPQLERTRETVVERFSLSCDLRGGTIALLGLERTLTDAFVEVRYLDGPPISALLKPADPTLSLDAPPASPARDYLRIGVDHIIYGWDHLLFVIGLTLLVGGRKVWGVATAFTLAHSLTLAATALGVVALPSRPVEILIAASIVLLGVEILQARRGNPGLGARAPYLIAFLIGLIHGFGFAGALAEIGLPTGTELLALFLFNLGVELGQFAVIGATLLVLTALSRFAQNWRRPVETLATYGLAAVAMFWVIDRVLPYLNVT
jgi:hydrogenase/urease accessory protein HupE